MFDHQVVHPKVLTLDGLFISSPLLSTKAKGYEPCSIWGPTCDSIDCISKLSYLPTTQLEVGDWLRWESMGAYTICAASQVKSSSILTRGMQWGDKIFLAAVQRLQAS